jgi:hypothetical protein
MMLFPFPTIKCLSLFPGLFTFIYFSTLYLSLSLSWSAVSLEAAVSDLQLKGAGQSRIDS